MKSKTALINFTKIVSIIAVTLPSQGVSPVTCSHASVRAAREFKRLFPFLRGCGAWFANKRDASHFSVAPLDNCRIEHVLRDNQEAESFRKIGIGWQLKTGASNAQVPDFHVDDAVHV